MPSLRDIQQIMSNTGLAALGISNPSLSIHWTSVRANIPVEDASNPLVLSSSDNWLAPCHGLAFPDKQLEKITLPNGSRPSAGLVFQVFPPVFLRLQRFYSTIIEGQTTNTHQPQRPVPYFFVYTDTSGAATAGEFRPGDDLGISGNLSIHDQHGLPIDPVAVAGIWNILIDTHSVLEAQDNLLSPTTTSAANRQINDIAGIGTRQSILHAVHFDHAHYSAAETQLENISALSGATSFYQLTTPANPITRSTDAPTDLRIAAFTFGRLDTTFTQRPLASGVTLHRDFNRVIITELEKHLIGERDDEDDFPAATFEERPSVRHNEVINFGFNGNALLGHANQILDGSPTLSLVVSPVIETDFQLPTDASDANAQWPAFPSNSAGDAGTNKVSGEIGKQLTTTAHFITGTEADVILTLSSENFEEGQSVRIYQRLFLADGRTARGDGAGAIVNADLKVGMILKDPFKLVEPGIPTSLPPAPLLFFDLVVTNRNNNARVFGNLKASVGIQAAISADETSLLSSETNTLGGATFRAVEEAGLIGLGSTVSTTTSLSSLEQIRDFILGLEDTTGNRKAPRLPSMVRFDSMLAARSSTGNWQGQISGAYLKKDSRNAKHHLGSPGSPGGEEVDSIGLLSGNGLLAYDIARAALRRSSYIVSRLTELESNNWNTPAPSTSGTFSTAILQTIAPGCETPEFMLYEDGLNAIPDSWAALVDSINTIMPNLPSSLGGPLTTAMTNLRNSTKGDRLYDEFKREYTSTVYGRRDAFWATRSAIQRAKKLIYIEGESFSPSRYGDSGPEDLVELIRNRLTEEPNLKVVLALSKKLTYGRGYEAFAAFEYSKRKEAIEGLIADNDERAKRIIAFHPIGFPGRPLRLMTNLMIIDDNWAMIGTSRFRRRGFYFDGAQDVVLTDRNIKNGKSDGINQFRKKLMFRHLESRNQATSNFPNPSAIRLEDLEQAPAVFRELLRQGGVGLIEPLWDGIESGSSVIPSTDFPAPAIADPIIQKIDDDAATISAILAYLSIANAPL